MIRGNADFVLLGQLSVEQQQAAFKIITGKSWSEFKTMVSENDSYTFWLYNNTAVRGDRCTQVRADEDFNPKFRLTFKNHTKAQQKKGNRKKKGAGCGCVGDKKDQKKPP